MPLTTEKRRGYIRCSPMLAADLQPESLHGGVAGMPGKRRKPDVPITVRLPADLLERLDAEGASMSERNQGVKIARADVIRALLWRALNAKEEVPTDG